MSTLRSSRDGISEVQGTLVLIVVIAILAILVKSTVGDSIVAAALDFGHFRVWGGHNDVSYTVSAVQVEITYPPAGGTFYSDQQIAISGSATATGGRTVTLVYYRLNGGPWKKADVSGSQWSGTKRRYLTGSYHVEAIAYDDAGDESPVASSTFESLFRPYPDSKYVSDDIPKEMTAGDWYDVQIKYSNTGFLPWNATYGYSLSPYEPTFPGESAIGMGSENILPSSDHSFTTRLTAPSTAGEYTIGYMMYCPDFEWFGEELSKSVTVVASSHDAKVVSVNMPSEMLPGETRDVSITMQNTGTAAWYATGSHPVYLWMVDGTNGAAYKFNGSSDRILMSPTSVVRKDDQYTFNFKIKAPAAGSYYLQYRMMWDGNYVFGQIAGCTITVKNPPTPTPTPNPPAPTPDPYQAYLAYGKMYLNEPDGTQYRGIIPFYCDGNDPYNRKIYQQAPFSARGSSSSPDAPWDIGGPNGHYRLYYYAYGNDFSFDMNNGGEKGPVIFYRTGR
jgi:hypothetical protein